MLIRKLGKLVFEFSNFLFQGFDFFFQAEGTAVVAQILIWRVLGMFKSSCREPCAYPVHSCLTYTIAKNRFFLAVVHMFLTDTAGFTCRARVRTLHRAFLQVWLPARFGFSSLLLLLGRHISRQVYRFTVIREPTLKSALSELIPQTIQFIMAPVHNYLYSRTDLAIFKDDPHLKETF